jgi:putative addiction module component (TIGR02574 family)
MSPKTRKLLDGVLRLSTRERADIATVLIHSLVPDEDVQLDPAWDAEIARRVKELDAGTVSTVPWSKVRKHLRGHSGLPRNG